jgi:hypothetical protein
VSTCALANEAANTTLEAMLEVHKNRIIIATEFDQSTEAKLLRPSDLK